MVLAVVAPVRPLAVQQRYSQEVQVRAATLVVGLHVLHLPNDDVQQDLREDARMHNTEKAHARVRQLSTITEQTQSTSVTGTSRYLHIVGEEYARGRPTADESDHEAEQQHVGLRGGGWGRHGAPIQLLRVFEECMGTSKW